MITNQIWIRTECAAQPGTCPVFVKSFRIGRPVTAATLSITGKGVYYAELNRRRVGDFILAPGSTVYEMRHQYQTYDIAPLLIDGENTLEVTLAGGWYGGRIAKKTNGLILAAEGWIPAIIAELVLTFADGTTEVIGTDESWLVGQGPVIFSDIYDGEVFDATKTADQLRPVTVDRHTPKSQLIPQEGETVAEQERFSVRRIITTPRGETVLDFGQNLAGYPEVTVTAMAGERISLSFAEVLDKDGNFYNENYRSAECRYDYTCRDGLQTYKPRCTFYGFRYIRIDEFPSSATLTADSFTAIAVYSKLRKTGCLSCSDPRLNQLFSNVFWGQRSNFLDIPTDCPQRNERVGWTGDAQVFCTTASYNFDTLRFFLKWMHDMDAMRIRDGFTGFYIPGKPTQMAGAWSDAAVIVPWQIYRTYGDISVLREMIGTMISHLEAVARISERPDTWYGGENVRQFGDWLASDSLQQDQNADFVLSSYSGATDPNFIQAAFYAYDASLVARALDVLEQDSTHCWQLHQRLKAQFQKDYPVYHTQTECILALRFGLTPNPAQTSAQLAEMIRQNGDRMTTGFVGTPHILHALSENGCTELAYTLLLQEQFPSWLYSVNRGATTIWEHWDSIDEDGRMWSAAMNSFNHYAYGAVADWVYEVAAGIRQEPDSAGFARPVIRPHPDRRLGWLEASIETVQGLISSKWNCTPDGSIRYEITVPTTARIIIGDREQTVERGVHIFYQ